MSTSTHLANNSLSLKDKYRFPHRVRIVLERAGHVRKQDFRSYAALKSGRRVMADLNRSSFSRTRLRDPIRDAKGKMDQLRLLARCLAAERGAYCLLPVFTKGGNLRTRRRHRSASGGMEGGIAHLRLSAFVQHQEDSTPWLPLPMQDPLE